MIVLDSGTVAAQGKPEEIFTNEKLMKKVNLDLPFAMKAAKAFERQGLQLKPVMNTEELVEELCRLK